MVNGLRAYLFARSGFAGNQDWSIAASECRDLTDHSSEHRILADDLGHAKLGGELFAELSLTILPHFQNARQAVAQLMRSGGPEYKIIYHVQGQLEDLRIGLDGEDSKRAKGNSSSMQQLQKPSGL